MKRCPTCNTQVKRGHGYKSATKYCSYKCYQLKPPRVIEVEEEFNNTLGINRGTYRAWKIKFGG